MLTKTCYCFINTDYASYSCNYCCLNEMLTRLKDMFTMCWPDSTAKYSGNMTLSRTLTSIGLFSYIFTCRKSEAEEVLVYSNNYAKIILRKFKLCIQVYNIIYYKTQSCLRNVHFYDKLTL